MARLLRQNAITTTGLALALIGTIPGCRESRTDPLVALELESMENTRDGCTACGCRARGELGPGGEGRWWISFGLVEPDGSGGWQAAGASSHCRSGSFAEAASDFHEILGTPYVILDLAATNAPSASGGVRVEAELTIQKLSGFDAEGRPIYGQRTQTRTLDVVSETELVLPLLLPDDREGEAFGIHEVLFRLRAEARRRESAASYGAISITADVPGAEILLDGGFVGRVEEARPTLLSNVLTGARVVGVRDFSGREVSRELVVAEGRIEVVRLEALELGSRSAEGDLVAVGPNPQEQAEYWRVKDGQLMVKIPAGEFLMGSADEQGQPDERPQHRVYTSAFLIDKTEITWRQLRKFTEASGSKLPPEPIWGSRDDYPAAFVLWDEAQAYCEWVGGRLPTEAEWEKAARGVDGNVYPWGNQWDSRRCNSISGGLHQPESVGSHPGCVSPYGVLDMSGNMWEWCADRYGESYYAEGVSQDPKGPGSGRLRVMRGGAWMSQPSWLRTAYRAKRSPTSRNADHGFRCAQDAPED